MWVWVCGWGVTISKMVQDLNNKYIHYLSSQEDEKGRRKLRRQDGNPFEPRDEKKPEQKGVISMGIFLAIFTNRSCEICTERL